MAKYNAVTKPGKVYLVGSGPGDPGLLTCRARELIERCDVICHDKLISSAVLALAPAGTLLLPTGYRGYCGTDINYGMHPTVIEQALAGKSVLRLKSGDPFIFGRATEECTELQRYGIEYEVVPGITAALGASSYAGFPLTSAGMASDVTIASGHQSSRTITSWASLGASTGTLVLYMGAKKLAQHAARLIQEGRDPNTPVAHISAATSAKQCVTTGTLSTIGEKVLALNNTQPALVVMGEVVALADKLDWRSKLPLAGQEIVLAGVSHRDALLEQTLRDAGAIVTDAPRVTVDYQWHDADWQRVEQAEQLHFHDVHAVASWWYKLKQQKCDLRRTNWRMSAADAETAEALHDVGLFDVQIGLPHVLPFTSLGGTHHADICCWQEHVSPIAFQLSAPDIAIIGSVVACQALLDEHPYVLQQAGQIYVVDAQSAELLACEGITFQYAEAPDAHLLNDAQEWVIDIACGA